MELLKICLVLGIFWIPLTQRVVGSSLDRFHAAKNKFTPICQHTIDLFVEEFPDMHTRHAAKFFCRFMMPHENITKHQVLVKAGFCTDLEFNTLITKVCWGFRKSLMLQDEGRQALYSAVNSTSRKCQNQLFSCVTKSFIAKIALQEQQYWLIFNNSKYFRDCDLISPRSCTETDIQVMKSAVRHHPESEQKRLSSALIATSERCQKQVEICFTNSDSAISYIKGEKYCSALHVNESGTTTTSCLIQGDNCDEADVKDMIDIACKGAKLHCHTFAVIVFIIIGLTS